MKYIHKIVLSALACVGLCVPAYANPGDSCDEPMLLQQGFQETIEAACTRWYIANTFDLPMEVSFYPSNPSSSAPTLYLDFSCTSGHYEDSIINSLFGPESSFYVKMPYKDIPSKSYDEEGNAKFTKSFGKFYRDLLLQQGIDYNVPVYIRVDFPSSGSLVMEPDAFNNCMDGYPFIHLGDTVDVEAEDTKNHVIVPYVQWQYDSIRYVWRGTKPCTIAIGNKCGFDPTDTEDETIMDGGTIQPNGVFKVSSELLQEYVNNQVDYPNEAGMYFAKFYSEEPGRMIIEKMPTPDPEGEAILLKHGREAQVYRNNTDQLYAINRGAWQKATRFITPTKRVMKMYIGKTADFALEDAIETYHFAPTEEGHELALFSTDMEALWKKTTDNYLYIRIDCSEKTTIKPLYWYPNECAMTTPRLEAPSLTMELPRRKDAVYSLLYSDWKGGDWTFYWDANTQSCSVTLGDSCAQISSLTDPHAFALHTISAKQQWVIPADAVDTMEKYVDEDGYLYICFFGGQKANITITTSAQEEVDPPCAPYDSVCTTSAWDSIWWCGTKYTQNGEYHYNPGINEDNGCIDTLYTLHLTIHTTGYASMSDTGCDSLVFNGHKYTVSGVYKDTTILGDGNRVITTRNLTIHHTSYGAIAEQACEVYISPSGKEYIYPGTYNDTITNAIGCDSVIQIELALIEDCRTYDTIFFCEGFNYEHDEMIRPDWVNRYRPYIYESPAEWDYMDGVELQHDGGKTLMDLHKAEENLYKHYTDSLMPITTISWSHRPEGKKTYEPITVEDEPQWIEAGSLALRLQFLCGETYSTSYVTDIDNVDADATPVKRIENGRVIILRGGVKYDMLGNVIK